MQLQIGEDQRNLHNDQLTCFESSRHSSDSFSPDSRPNCTTWSKYVQNLNLKILLDKALPKTYLFVNYRNAWNWSNTRLVLNSAQ